jgi:16S rRNA U516 pseudouridylate synthase RsuA-like enzyme
VGPVTLEGLSPGEWRELPAQEVKALWQAAASDHR